MSVLKFPDNPKNSLKCADWLELMALISSDRSCSLALLERNLKRLSTYDATRTMEQDAEIEFACVDVMDELVRRAKAAGSAYPFKINGSLISVHGSADDHAAYVFCLCLSWFGWNPKKGRKAFPRRMFEDLSKYAASQFVGGKALRFGAPRTELPKSFKQAVPQLCIEIGEGQAKALSGRISAQDDTLDIIAWRNFLDEAEGKLFLVGQCASGNDWEQKKRDLDIEAFFDEWCIERPPSVRSMCVGLFVPHRIPRHKWIPLTRKAGIIFDRCRISALSHASPVFSDKTNYLDWSNRTLSGVRVG